MLSYNNLLLKANKKKNKNCNSYFDGIQFYEQKVKFLEML